MVIKLVRNIYSKVKVINEQSLAHPKHNTAYTTVFDKLLTNPIHLATRVRCRGVNNPGSVVIYITHSVYILLDVYYCNSRSHFTQENVKVLQVPVFSIFMTPR